MLRRLRSLIPTSPLPWHWHARFYRALLAAILVLAAVGAVVSVLVQRGSDESPAAAPGGLEASPDSSKALKALKALTPEQKADAVVAAGIDPSSAERTVSKAQLGGIVIGPDDWAAGGASLVKRLRAAGGSGERVPPLIIGLQEGGVYRAYPDLPPAETQLEIGLGGDPQAARGWSESTAKALKAAGFDVNLGPLADVAGPASPIADRSFSDDPALASALVGAAVKGCKSTGLACAVPHFPGLGAASDDTDINPATVSLDPASLGARDLAAFRAAFDAGAPATVLSLAFYTAYDPVTPAALSPEIATGLLRGELGFEGLAISDDLSAGSIAAGLGAPEAAVQAISAGTDLVVVDDPVLAGQARAAILAAAKEGTVSEQRLDEAATRVLELKKKLGLLP
ncbi:MAG: hypothetical protein H0V15_00810 [Solirubrobacterales bacterium]|nr:hypothetical protein [Solirubrobacterales bacterium]